MARKADPNSVPFLKRQVAELVAVNEALVKGMVKESDRHAGEVRRLTADSFKFQTELGRLSGENAALREANERQVAALTEAVERNATQSRSLAAVSEERDRLAAETKGLAENAGFWRNRYDDASKTSQKHYDDAKRYEKERDALRLAQETAHERVRAAERDRDEARIYAEQMRRQAYPKGPLLPWDGPYQQ